jgi:L-ascorbate metabolism protein UlaG (beta-lactamase superfamily)
VGIELAGIQVMTDPMLTQRVAIIRRVGTRPQVARDVTRLVLISHAHHDHLHRASLRRAGSNIRLVVPVGLGALVSRWGYDDVTELPVGGSLRHGDVEVTAVRAVHSGHRVPIGPTAEAIGYVLAGGGRTIYFAGDTDVFDEMADIGDLGLDLALLPVWGWGPRLGPGHMNPTRAAEAVEILRPTLVVPIHWGTLWPIAMRWRRYNLTEPPLELVAEVERRALASRVVILAPGETLDLATLAGRVA